MIRLIGYAAPPAGVALPGKASAVTSVIALSSQLSHIQNLKITLPANWSPFVSVSAPLAAAVVSLSRNHSTLNPYGPRLYMSDGTIVMFFTRVSFAAMTSLFFGLSIPAKRYTAHCLLTL